MLRSSALTVPITPRVGALFDVRGDEASEPALRVQREGVEPRAKRRELLGRRVHGGPLAPAQPGMQKRARTEWRSRVHLESRAVTS